MALPGRGIQIVIDPTEWFRLKKDLDQFDPALAKALRKRIRAAGNVGAEAVRKTLREPSPGGGDNSGEGRAALIAATKVTVSFARRAAGARIVTGSSKLSAAHKGLLNVYNKKSFRHPVFASRSAGATWVEQQGRPYFGSAIYRAMSRAVVEEIFSALDDATKAIGARAR